MRKLLWLIVCLMTMVLSAVAQDELYLTNRSYPLEGYKTIVHNSKEINYTHNHHFYFYSSGFKKSSPYYLIDITSLDVYNIEVLKPIVYKSEGFVLSYNEIKDFVEFLKKVKEQFNKYIEITENNGVRDYSSGKIKGLSYKLSCLFTHKNREFYCSSSVLYCEFTVRNGNYEMRLTSEGEFKCKYYGKEKINLYLWFNNPFEIDSYITNFDTNLHLTHIEAYKKELAKEMQMKKEAEKEKERINNLYKSISN